MNAHEITEQFAICSKQFVLYLSHSAGDYTELASATHTLSQLDQVDLLDGKIWLTFPTYAAALDVFGGIVGDDGPTHTNSYDGPGRVYALLAGPDGLITENT